MSAHDPFAPKTIGPHRVYPEPPADPATEVPGHPADLFAWMLEPGDDHLERARRVDLAEEAEMGRPGRIRSDVLDAIDWHRAVIAGDIDDDPEGPPAGWRTPGGALVAEGSSVPLEEIEVAEGEEATLTNDGTGEALPPIDDAEPPAEGYSDDDVPANATDVVAWVRAGTDEADKGLRAEAAWRVEVARDGDVRATVKAELDKHLE